MNRKKVLQVVGGMNIGGTKIMVTNLYRIIIRKVLKNKGTSELYSSYGITRKFHDELNEECIDKIIPKIIHYCWFGGNDKPEIVKKCIKSWQRNLKEYEIIEWNEESFDINKNNFAKEAYEQGMYAFVSDYVRVYALYNYGGIYLDTDVEVFKSFDDLLNNESFWGFEEKNFIATSTIGAEKGNKFIKKFLDTYEGKSFITAEGKIDTLTNVAIVSKMIESVGIKLNGKLQKIEGIGTFYPQEYFSPYDYINCYSKGNENTYAIHYFYKSWLPFNTRVKSTIKKTLAKLVGGHNIAKLRVKLQG